jgi:hypothetical protein
MAVAAAPGGKVALPYSVRNSSETVAHGAVLSFTKPAVAEFGAKYRNCQYTDWWVLCTFDSDLAAGEEYTLAKPQALTVRADSPALRSFNGFYQWATPADAEIEWLDEFRKLHPVRANGGELRRVEQAPKLRANAQTDTNELDNAAEYPLGVTGENVGDDAAAVGVTIKGYGRLDRPGDDRAEEPRAVDPREHANRENDTRNSSSTRRAERAAAPETAACRSPEATRRCSEVPVRQWFSWAPSGTWWRADVVRDSWPESSPQIGRRGPAGGLDHAAAKPHSAWPPTEPGRSAPVWPGRPTGARADGATSRRSAAHSPI